jgi:hypothetical protein
MDVLVVEDQVQNCTSTLSNSRSTRRSLNGLLMELLMYVCGVSSDDVAELRGNKVGVKVMQ